MCPYRQYSDSEGIFDSKCSKGLNLLIKIYQFIQNSNFDSEKKNIFKSFLPNKIGNEIEYVQSENEDYAEIQVCCADMGDENRAETDIKRVPYPIQSQFCHSCHHKHKSCVSVVAFFVKIT